MRVLSAHTYYSQRGGEDAVFESEVQLLRQKGHEVVEFLMSNNDLVEVGPLRAAREAIWSTDSSDALTKIIGETRPDVAHFHNTFVRISPSAYHACFDAGVPVVQTLHNYRLLCPAATLFRDGRVCEDCLGERVPWPAVRHGCWHGSRPRTAVVATMLATHRIIRTWDEKVDTYVALTEFCRRKFIEGGLPEDKLLVKPNFVHPDPGVGNHDGGYALYVGRLSREKGIHTLVSAWRHLKQIPLRIAGDGPLRGYLEGLIRENGLTNVQLLGGLARAGVLSEMKDATFLLVSSECYETFGMSIVEGFACALPVIASRLGAMREVVDDGRTGLHVEPGMPEDWVDKVKWAWSNPREMRAMGKEARLEFEERYTAERNYRMLVAAYEAAIARSPP